jgi:hypothetical protein
MKQSELRDKIWEMYCEGYGKTYWKRIEEKSLSVYVMAAAQAGGVKVELVKEKVKGRKPTNDKPN